MKSNSLQVKKKKFKTVQDTVHGQGFVVVVACSCLEKLCNTAIVDY